MATNNCTTGLPNPGTGDCKFDIKEIKRFLFVAYRNENNTINNISKTNAATIASWQTLFDKPDYRAVSALNDLLEKVVPTIIVYGAMNEQAKASAFDEDGYYEKLADGDYNISFKLNNVNPYYIKQLKELESITIGVYMVDGNTKVWGKENGDYIEPLKIINIEVPNKNLKSRDSISQEIVQFRLSDPQSMNDLYGVEIADADVFSDSDFYSLINASMVVTNDALTGGTFVITDYNGNPVTGITYDQWTFRQTDSLATTVTLAASGSVTESPEGTYTVNEASLLTTGKSYYVEIALDTYNIVRGTVTAP